VTTEPKPAEPQLSALMKGLKVLEAVPANHRISDIATETGLSVSTVHRILSDLVEYGWVEQDQERAYRPGRRVQGLASLLHNDEQLVRTALPHLQALRDRVGFTVHMARFAHNELSYVAKIDGPAAYQMRSRIGDTIPLWSSAIGKAILAALDEQTSRDLLKGAQLQRRTRSTIMSKSSLWNQVELIRRRGWAVDDEENELHIRCVGVALQDASGRVIGGLSTSALDHEMTPATIDRVAPLVMETGARINKLLGGDSQPR
jgi:IclR family acetate operon transcriptional repressor